MYVARILYPVEVLGPGKRVGIWFCGCPRRCNGCSNPELWEFQPRYKTKPETVFEMVNSIAKNNHIDGFTITGGEPMFQPEDLQKLIGMLCTISDDILVYTGFDINNLPVAFLNGIAVLIDGEYVRERNTDCFLRGSENQKIHILNEKYRDRYETLLKSGKNRIQNFTTNDGIVSVGIHHPGFINEADDMITGKGFPEKDNSPDT